MSRLATRTTRRGVVRYAGLISLLLCLLAPGAAAAAELPASDFERSTTQDLGNKRYIAPGDRAYVVGADVDYRLVQTARGQEVLVEVSGSGRHELEVTIE